MENEVLFKVTSITEFSIFSIIRIENHRLAKKAGYRTVIEESRHYLILLSIFICYEVFTLFLYLLYPQPLMWAAISMPIWLRWIGVPIGIMALLFFVWVHRSLGKNFSAKLRIKDQQILVTDGPYHWLRHAMYAAFYLLHISVFFLTANWFIGVTWIAGLTLIIALRVNREEDMMIERFGGQYRSYMKHTGRFIPLVRPKTVARRK